MRLSILGVGSAIVLYAVPLAAQHDHAAEMHSHRGVGPHFIDAFFTENAYVERKIRPDVFLSTSDAGQFYTAQLEVEWALLPMWSLILHAPVHHLAPDLGSAETGIGDVSVGSKIALINDRQRFVLAVGSDLELPTGDADRGLGEDHAAAAPFLLTWVPFGPERRFTFQGSAHADIPLASDEGVHAEVSSAWSWTSPLGVTPILEGIVTFPLDGDEDPSWAVAPQVRWEFATAWEVGAAVRIPVRGPRDEDVRIAVGLIRHFPLPR